jgi:HK97 family phage major capsid protein
MKTKFTISLALFALALLFVSVDVMAGTGLTAHLFANPEGMLIAPVAAATLPEAIKAELEQIGKDVKAVAQQALDQAANAAGVSAETKDTADKLLLAQSEILGRVQSAEQIIARIEQGNGTREDVKSLGELIATSEQAKAFNPQMRGSFSVTVPRAAIDSSSGSAGDLIQPTRVPGIVAIPQQRLFVRDLLPVATTDSNSIEYVRESGFTNNANVVSENPTDPKPESDLTFELDTAPVVTIAHWIRASKQVLRNAGQLQGYINNRLLYGLRLREEAQLLKGSGVGLNMNGIYTQASAYANPGVVVQHETAIDRIRIMMLQVALAEYDADGIVINPIDWAEIELTKTDDNAYLMANPRGLLGPTLWGRPVVATKSLNANEALVGAFQLGAQVWQNEAANVTVSNQDRDNFVKNMVTILAEMDEALTVFRPEAFVKGSLAGLPVS